MKEKEIYELWRKNAVEDACRIEHIISSESFEAIKRISKPE